VTAALKVDVSEDSLWACLRALGAARVLLCDLLLLPVLLRPLLG
jgi:hypothetical protein